jgi:hypothetical protein
VDLRSVLYEPLEGLSLFERWDLGLQTQMQAPLAFVDPDYRSVLMELFRSLNPRRKTVLSVGSGNGVFELELQMDGWHVLATDLAVSAVKVCRLRGLKAEQFDLLSDALPEGTHEVVYVDGVFGHLWNRQSRTTHVWSALSRLAKSGSIAVVSNDLSDTDRTENFGVRSSNEIQFYRPTAGSIERDAAGTGWVVGTSLRYEYQRRGANRRREILVARYW